jgi:predicted transcriptional regulator
MAKYNRLCVTLSDESNTRLNSLVNNTNKKVQFISKSAIVELALKKFFKDATAESIANELSEQLVVE